jgi:hypothetical protein
MCSGVTEGGFAFIVDGAQGWVLLILPISVVGN